jgi:S1-C subfamily serine protease
MQKPELYAVLAVAITTTITFIILLTMTFALILYVDHPAMGQLGSSSSLSFAAKSNQIYPSSSSLDSVFQQVDNSVVMITSKVSNNLPNPQTQNASELGSGFIYDTQGHVITASHLVAGTKLVDVTFVDGSRYSARTLGRDPLSDIAVLQIVGNNSALPLRPLIIDNSSGLRVGQQVVAIGHPFGIANTMTTGIISQTGYLLSIPDIGVFFPDVIQTDAAINPGNSGGPLLNTKAQVIGLNVGRIISIGAPGPYPGLTVATPSNALLRIVPRLIADGNYSHPYIGLVGTTLTSDLAQAINNLPRDFKGVLVSSIVMGGPADKAGVEASTVDKYDNRHWGDIITAIDGHPVIRNEDLISYIEQHKSAGEMVSLSIYRNGHVIGLDATLSTRPTAQSQNLQPLSIPPL